MEDFMTLIRVYFQSVIASNMGISNLAVFPDLATFKRSLKVPTLNNKLGLGERSACKKMLQSLYGLSDTFFKEIDHSIKKGCKTPNDIRNYMLVFQGFSQDLMMLVGNMMKWKFRVPSFLKSAMRTMTDKTVHDIFNKIDWKDDGERKAAFTLRKYQQMLGLSEEWISEYVYNVVVLAKKEPKPSQEDIKKAEQKIKK